MISEKLYNKAVLLAACEYYWKCKRTKHPVSKKLAYQRMKALIESREIIKFTVTL